MFGQTWARRGLRRGDLTALAEIGRRSGANEADRLDRLSRRGFVTIASDGSASLTAKGRFALIARRLGPR